MGQISYLQLLYCHLRSSTKANTSVFDSSECRFLVVLTGFLALGMVRLYSCSVPCDCLPVRSYSLFAAG